MVHLLVICLFSRPNRRRCTHTARIRFDQILATAALCSLIIAAHWDLAYASQASSSNNTISSNSATFDLDSTLSQSSSSQSVPSSSRKSSPLSSSSSSSQLTAASRGLTSSQVIEYSPKNMALMALLNSILIMGSVITAKSSSKTAIFQKLKRRLSLNNRRLGDPMLWPNPNINPYEDEHQPGGGSAAHWSRRSDSVDYPNYQNLLLMPRSSVPFLKKVEKRKRTKVGRSESNFELSNERRMQLWNAFVRQQQQQQHLLDEKERGQQLWSHRHSTRHHHAYDDYDDTVY